MNVGTDDSLIAGWNCFSALNLKMAMAGWSAMKSLKLLLSLVTGCDETEGTIGMMSERRCWDLNLLNSNLKARCVHFCEFMKTGGRDFVCWQKNLVFPLLCRHAI